MKANVWVKNVVHVSPILMQVGMYVSSGRLGCWLDGVWIGGSATVTTVTVLWVVFSCGWVSVWVGFCVCGLYLPVGGFLCVCGPFLCRRVSICSLFSCNPTKIVNVCCACRQLPSRLAGDLKHLVLGPQTPWLPGGTQLKNTINYSVSALKD